MVSKFALRRRFSFVLVMVAAMVVAPTAFVSADTPAGLGAQRQSVDLAGSSTLAGLAAAGSPGSFRAVTPARVLDTRKQFGATGPVRPLQSMALSILGSGGVPTTGVSAVAINVTVTRPAGSGYLTVYPDGGARPIASNVNFVVGQTIANLVLVPVGSDGRIRLYNGSGGAVDLIADIAGYYLTGTPTAPGTFRILQPTRLLDTRSGTGATAARPVQGGNSIALKVAGKGMVPTAGVSAVVLSVTATRPVRSGHLTAYADGAALLSGSSVNFSSGQTIASLVLVPLGADGSVRLFNASGGPVDMLADLAGYYLAGAGAVPGALQLLAPARVLDTLTGPGAAGGPLSPGRSLALDVANRSGVPAHVSGVVINVTAVAPSGSGSLSVFSDGSSTPTTSTVNFASGQTIAGLVMVPVGADGSIRLFNGGGVPVQVFVDVLGYYLPGAEPASCANVGTDPAGTFVTRWDPVVRCVLSMLGQSSGNVADVDTIIEYESSGNPNAINLYDLNAQAGHPSEGLIQVIQPTFDTFRSSQLPADLYNPAANLYAGLNYAIHTYGSIHNIPGLISLRNGGGYKGYVVGAN
ncbi:MAG: transglycosylase SLT domain-containing protein [Actinomycetota bacterium]|nr:transglycosylase SLT domain-containing protein [Actinomycetota bacterium]